jgi:uncharacterized protein (AIM24 family)
MKKSKIISLLAVSTLSVGILAACSTSDKTETSKSSSAASSSESSSTADAYSGATVAAKDFDSLQKGFAKNGAWLNALDKDMDASGKTLTVDGLFSNDNSVISRKMALYNQDDNHVVTELYTLTVKSVVVNSPNFYIANGTIKGDVQVNAADFHGQTGKKADGSATQPVIDGNLHFATQDLLDTYNALPDAQKVKVTGTTDVVEGTEPEFAEGKAAIGKTGIVTISEGADAKSGATTNAKDFDILTKGMGEEGGWLGAITADMDASGKTLEVKGTFVNKVISRKLALYTQDDAHKVTARFTLTVAKLNVSSPGFYISNGTVKGDVYIAESASGFHGQNGTGVDGKATIDGNLYFATQDQLDTYNELPDAQKVTVTGQTAVKAS